MTWNMGFIPEYAGWLPPEDRTLEAYKIHESYVFDTPVVDEVFSSPGYNKERPRLWEVTDTAIRKGYIPEKYIRNGQFKNIAQIIGSCFPAGTLVRMANGTEKPIEEIKIGDEVISHTGKVRKVINTFERDYSGDLVTIRPKGTSFVVSCTSDHLIAIDNEDNKTFHWQSAGSLDTNCRVLLGKKELVQEKTIIDVTDYLDTEVEKINGGVTTKKHNIKHHRFGLSRKIKSITKQAVKNLTVYDFEVEEDHSFLANGIVVHNCVGFGAGNMLLWSSLIDAIIRKQTERILVPFVPYHYGRGRLHSGIRGPGSGSLGSGQAKAFQVDGFLACDMENLPLPSFSDAVYWTERIEYDWSDGARISDEWVQEGQKHLIPTVARVTDTEQAAKLADSFYVFTIASNWGGRMQCPVREGVLLNERTGTWNHQMWVLDYIIHSSFGRLWWVGNNWKYVHGKDPGGSWDNNTGAPEGGFYIRDKDLQYILAQRDSYAFADPQGFVDRSREFDWLMG